jgi:hypothetical protein
MRHRQVPSAFVPPPKTAVPELLGTAKSMKDPPARESVRVVPL